MPTKGGKKRFPKVLFLIVIISFLLTACGSGAGSGGDVTESREVSNIDSVVCEPTKESYQVVTIYFAGTGMTEEWWDSASAVGAFGYGFWTPELVAMLHKWQITSATHKKTFIDGIGTGCPNFDILDLLNQGIPQWEHCRGWETSMQEAEDFLTIDVLPLTSEKLILNLVGLSRGGVLTMRFANRIYAMENIKDRIERINILAFEPAAGDTTLSPSEFILNDLVSQYVGMYATDERAAFFSPAIPGFESYETEVWMFRVPGAHETLVGNIQTDGHHTNWNPGCGFLFLEECFDDELLNVSWVTTFIAEKLLGSLHWGNAGFNMDKLDAWQAGMSADNSEDLFVGKVADMLDYNYSLMRRRSVHDFIGYESCQYNPPQVKKTWYSFLDWPFWGGYNYERCTESFFGDPPMRYVELLESGPFSPIDPLIDAEAALDRLQELGFPDSDDDGVNNEDDMCEFTKLGDIVDPNNGCSIDQLCHCEGPCETTENWKNHGQYVSCIAHSAESFVLMGLITEAEKGAIVSEAGGSSCGHKK